MKVANSNDGAVASGPTGPSSYRVRIRFFAVAKTLFAFLGFSALVTEVATLVAQRRFSAGDFFSYFTVESNLLAVISLTVSGFAVVSGWTSRGLDFFRGAVTFCMTTTILIFIVLLSGYPSSELTAVPWDNTVLHYVMPIAVILDWLTASRVHASTARRALLWLTLPLSYLAYSLIRGAIVHWYPYPFMDPSLHGYPGVVIMSAVIAIILAVIAWGISTVARWSPLWADRHPDLPPG